MDIKDVERAVELKNIINNASEDLDFIAKKGVIMNINVYDSTKDHVVTFKCDHDMYDKIYNMLTEEYNKKINDAFEELSII